MSDEKKPIAVPLRQKVRAIVFQSRRDVVGAAWLLVWMTGAAFFEALGVGMVLPFVRLLEHPQLLDEHASTRAVKQFFGVTTHLGAVSLAGAALATLFIIKAAYLSFVQHRQSRYVHGREVEVAGQLVDGYLRRPYTFHLTHNSAELIRIVTNEVGQLHHHVVLPMFIIAVELLSVLVVVGLLVMLEPLVVPGVGLVVGGIAVGFYRSLHRHNLRLGERQREEHTSMTKWVMQGLGGIKEVKVLGIERFFVDSFDRASRVYGRTLAMHNTISAVPRFVLEAAGVLALASITVALFWLRGDPKSVIPVLGALAVAAVRLIPSAARILTSLTLIRYCEPVVDAVYADLMAVKDGEGDDAVSPEPLTIERELAVVDVTYTYPNAKNPSLRGVSLRLKKGESVALVGLSGAGKTTLVDLVLGLLVPDQGRLEVDGTALSRERLAGLRRVVGYVPQLVYLSDDSIRRNVAFGVEEGKIDDAKVWAALETAQLAEFVKTQSDALETFVGERGVRLSGGQRQRIGIARALYRDPQILVLDEATASLDGTTEREVVEAMERARSDRTSIVIAHRLSTVRGCDRLLLMQGGEILEEGSYDVLYENSPTFRAMADALPRAKTVEPVAEA